MNVGNAAVSASTPSSPAETENEQNFATDVYILKWVLKYISSSWISSHICLLFTQPTKTTNTVNIFCTSCYICSQGYQIKQHLQNMNKNIKIPSILLSKTSETRGNTQNITVPCYNFYNRIYICKSIVKQEASANFITLTNG